MLDPEPYLTFRWKVKSGVSTSYQQRGPRWPPNLKQPEDILQGHRVIPVGRFLHKKLFRMMFYDCIGIKTGWIYYYYTYFFLLALK